MKRYAMVVVFLLGMLAAAVPAFAQGGGGADPASDVIVLNDTTPGIDVVINPIPGTTGAIALELFQATVIVRDQAGNVVFQMTDPRVNTLELSIPPNATAYTLTVERLPGVQDAAVRVNSQDSLTSTDMAFLLPDASAGLGVNQQSDMALSAATPSQTVPVSIPQNTQGTVAATFPGAPVTAQMVDGQGAVVATLYNGAFDGLILGLEGGDYELTMLNTATDIPTVANVSVVPADESELAGAVVAPADTTVSNNNAIINTGAGAAPAQVSAAACDATIATSSINLRSGPGTGYSVLEYGFRGEQFPVGGVNTTGTWLLVGTDDGSAWIAGSLAGLNGDCSSLPVYDIPYREAQQPQVIVQQSPSSFIQAPTGANNSSAFGEHEDDDRYEHEEHEEHDD